MSTLTGRVDWESPWIFGMILFATYVVAQLFAAWMFGDGLADVYLPAVLAGAVAFAGIATGLRVVLNRYASPN